MRPRSWVAQDSSRAVLAGIPLSTLASPTVAITHSGPRLAGIFFFSVGGGRAAAAGAPRPRFPRSQRKPPPPKKISPPPAAEKKPPRPFFFPPETRPAPWGD